MARALMSKPRLLILDEASLGLSPVAVDTVFQAIGEIREAGTSVLLIEQNAHRSLSIADHAYVLDRGRITYDGPAHELDDPAAALRGVLRGRVPVSPAAPAALDPCPPGPGRERSDRSVP